MAEKAEGVEKVEGVEKEGRSEYRKKREVTIVGTILNLLLTASKYVVGYMVGSAALISDATHSASDYIGDLIVLLGIKLADRPADEDHPYGHGKFETFASFAVGLLVLGAGIFLLYDGLLKFIGVIGGDLVELDSDYIYALYVALVSIVVKEVLYRYTVFYGRRFASPVLLANAGHHRSDAYSSLGVFVGILFTLYFPSFRFMDPLAAMIVVGFILYTAWEILYPAFHELVETSDIAALKEIKEISDSTIGVKDSRDIRTRAIGGKLLVDMKIEVDSTFTLYQAYEIGERVKRNVKGKMKGVIDLIIHLEPSEETSISALEKQSNVERVVDRIINTYDSTLEYIKDIRYYYVNKGIDIIIIFSTKKELSAEEEGALSDVLKGLLRENYDYINRLYVDFHYQERGYKYR